MACQNVSGYTPWRIASANGSQVMVLGGLKQSKKVPVLREAGDEKIYTMQRGPAGAPGLRVIDAIPSSLNTGKIDPLFIPFLTFNETEILRDWSRGINRAMLVNPRPGVFWLGCMSGEFNPQPYEWIGESGFSLSLVVQILGLSEITF